MSLFSAKIAQGITFKKIIDSVKELIKSICLEVEQDGVRMQAMDSAHVSLLTFFLPRQGFAEYYCQKPFTIGISVEQLSRILNCITNADSLLLECEDCPTHLKINFENSAKNSEFYVSLLNVDNEQLGIPETEYVATIEMSSTEFSKICKDLNSITETIILECDDENFHFCMMSENGKGRISYLKNDTNKDVLLSTCIKEPISLSFSMKYLNFFSKAWSLTPKVHLKMGTDAPLVIEYPFETGGYLRFYLAPKIKEE